MDGNVAESSRVKPKPKAKVAKEKSGKEKGPSYNWSDSQTVSLMQVLKDYHNKNGFNKTYDWAEVNKEFEKRTGIDLASAGQYVARNKVEHMKKLWKGWCKLRFGMTGAGWDRCKGTVTLEDARWDSFKKTDDSNLLQFRLKGVDPVLCELWDDVFGHTMATGKHVMSPCMLKALQCIQLDVEEEDIEEFDLDDDVSDGLNDTDINTLDLVADLGLLNDKETMEALVARVRTNAPLNECLDSVHETMTTPLGTSTGPEKVNNKGNKIKKGGGLTLRQLLTRKRKSASEAFNEHISLVGDTSKKLLSIMEGSTTNEGPVERLYTFDESFTVIERLVELELLEEESKLWCFSITRLLDEVGRQAFMRLPKDCIRVTWLKYEYDTTHKVYVP